MKWIIFTNDTVQEYLDFINNHPDSGIWHYPAWLDFQVKSDRVVDGFIFGVKKDDKIVLGGIYLVYLSMFSLKCGYVPAGFLSTDLTGELYAFFLENLHRETRRFGTFYTEFDSITSYDGSFEKLIGNKKGHKLMEHAPIPQYTNLIPLDAAEEEILKAMKHKGRYNIKLAAQKGVEIRTGNEAFEEFTKILKDTAKRDGFYINPPEYYQTMLEMIPESELISAYHEGELLASGIFTYTKSQGLYYYGASSNHKRNLMAPYLVQWTAIRNAKEKGCRYFDFMGISPPDKPDDRLAGVTSFKLKFGGVVTRFNPSYHVIHTSPVYAVYTMLKKIQKILRK